MIFYYSCSALSTLKGRTYLNQPAAYQQTIIFIVNFAKLYWAPLKLINISKPQIKPWKISILSETLKATPTRKYRKLWLYTKNTFDGDNSKTLWFIIQEA